MHPDAQDALIVKSAFPDNPSFFSHTNNKWPKLIFGIFIVMMLLQCMFYLLKMHLLMKIPDAENFTDVTLVTDAVMEFMVEVVMEVLVDEKVDKVDEKVDKDEEERF